MRIEGRTVIQDDLVYALLLAPFQLYPRVSQFLPIRQLFSSCQPDNTSVTLATSHHKVRTFATFICTIRAGRSRQNPEKDKKFIGELDSIIESNISDPNLSVGDIAQMMYVSRSVLFSRVKTVTGITPNNYVKIKRLEKAAGYIMTRKYKINEICYLVGFNTPSYFTKCFFERFGVLPKDFNPGVHSEKDGEDA